MRRTLATYAGHRLAGRVGVPPGVALEAVPHGGYASGPRAAANGG